MNYYKIHGIHDNDSYIVEQMTKEYFIYNKGYFFTENSTLIDETILPKYLKKKFGLQNQCFFPYNEETEKIFKKEYDFKSRVPLSETSIQVPEELNSYLISNQYFVSPANSLAFGIFECYLRNHDNPFLSKTLFKDKSPNSFNYHYNNLFSYIFYDPIGKELYSEYLTEFQKINLTSPYDLQSICDNFSIGIEINKIENQKLLKCFVIAANPESSTIPIVKLLKYKDYLFVLYSPNQNDFDGYDESGKLQKGITRGEFYVDSFFQSSSDFKTQPFIDFIKESFDVHKAILKDTSSRDHLATLSEFSQKILTQYKNFAKTDQDSIQILINSLKSSCEAADKRLKKNVPPLSPKAAEQENFRMNQNYLLEVPQSNKSKNNSLDLLEDKYITQAQQVFDSKKPESANKMIYNQPQGISKTVIAPIEERPENKISGNLQFVNLTEGDAKYKTNIPAINPWNLGKFEEKATQNLSNNREEECKSCSKVAKVSLYHQKCPMCVKCFIISINQFGGKCTLCNTKILASEVGKFTEIQRMSCERCKKDLKITECRILICNCLLCSRCENESYSVKCCAKCSASLT
ncbi:hypothetical protein SteCoe_27421 [Stentor coeruleus]|uniref:Uncharacterized protein n=1 Tax=Stentor coeruleus TaxID=5963 RepID=A0A1R2BAI2_9CILI|nr:hypothetical protein SteCoe_27421 [Stentor coeruleus]